MIEIDARYCQCDGWWEQEVFGRQPMENLRIAFDGRRIVGSGIDIIGPFTLAGVVDEQGAVAIVKQYIQQHRVDYYGMYDGEGTMSGEWRIGYFRGPWLITIRRTPIERAAEIVEFVPGKE